MSDLNLTTGDEAPKGKSLAPLIAAFTVIILLTIILINSGTGKRKKQEGSQSPQKGVMELSGNSRPAISHKPATPVPRDSKIINVDVSLVEAKKLLAENKVEEAEDKLRTILVFAPDNAQTLTLLGGILYYSGREKEAESIFRRQIKLNPKDHLAYNRLGSALAKQKRYQEAINSVAMAVGLKPDSGEAQINLAGLYSLANDKKSALLHFRKAAKLLGEAILPLSHDRSFDNVRSSPEFQTIISETLMRRASTKAASKSSDAGAGTPTVPSGGGKP